MTIELHLTFEAPVEDISIKGERDPPSKDEIPCLAFHTESDMSRLELLLTNLVFDFFLSKVWVHQVNYHPLALISAFYL